MSASPSVAVVMPAYAAAHLLPQSLPPLLESAGQDAVLVVDPGSTDGTAEVAAQLGARVISLGRRAGPAEARNAGVEEVAAEVVLFIDSDCVVHPDVVERVRRAFGEDPELVSLTGSYDDSPPDRGFFSRYMNLRHHLVHQAARREGASFWAGCGAVRRAAFRQVGGFDADRYPEPMIEDIELATRLQPLGRTALDPELVVKHLKRWTMRSVIATDIFKRAVPWSRLILERGSMPDDLNLRRSQRLAALLAPVVLADLVLLPLLGWYGYPLSCAALLAVFLLAAFLGRDLLAFFARREGSAFALGGWLFHQVHLTYSAATFALCSLAWRLGMGKSR